MPEFVPASDWIPAHVHMPPGMETSGPWDPEMVPYVRGVLEAYDDPNVRIILLPWAARCAKTTTGIALQIYGIQNLRLPALILAPDKHSAHDLIKAKYYPMIEQIGVMATKLRPERQRNIERGIELDGARIRVGYAGGVTTVASNPAALIHITEAAKCGSLGGGESAQSEAHPVYRAYKRAFLFPWNKKIIVEGTPNRKGDCIMTAEVMAATTQRRHYHVQCPHCDTFQRLQWSPDFGHYKTSGVKWEKPTGGHSTADLAAKTAYYECVSGCKITQEEWRGFIRSGKWVAEGQTVGNDGVITGEPTVESTTIAFGETLKAGFSSIYSLLHGGLGELARDWVSSLGNSEKVRQFINETLGLQYDPKPRAIEPHELQVRLKSDVPFRFCPNWTKFLIWWGDVGAVDKTLIFYWGVMAFGDHARSAFVDYDIAFGETKLIEHLGNMVYPVQGQRAEFRLKPIAGGLDSSDGNVSSSIYRICDALKIHPTKGAPLPLYQWFGGGFRSEGRSDREKKVRKKRGQPDLFLVGHGRTQSWIEERLSGVVAATSNDGLTFPAEMCDPERLEHAVVFAELLNDYLDGDKWERSGDNERRDVVRCCRSLAEHHVVTRRLKWDSLPPLAPPEPPRPTASLDAPARDATRPAAGFRIPTPFRISRR